MSSVMRIETLKRMGVSKRVQLESGWKGCRQGVMEEQCVEPTGPDTERGVRKGRERSCEPHAADCIGFPRGSALALRCKRGRHNAASSSSATIIATTNHRQIS